MKAFKNMVNSEEDVRFNNQTVLTALKDIGLKNSMEIGELVAPMDREMMMFVVELFFKLPFYTPKARIEFNATLGDICVKSIELSNPGKKKIEYISKIEGSSDFFLDTDYMVIEPGEK